MALASKKEETISPAVFFGEGAAAEGEFRSDESAHFGKFLCYLFVKTTYTPWNGD
jgi:hypothetical protein